MGLLEIKIATGMTLAHQKIKSSSLNFKMLSYVQKIATSRLWDRVLYSQE